MTTNSNGHCTPFQRLPTNVTPVNYDLSFEPDWTTHTYEATAIIQVEIKEQTDVIKLNAGNFTIKQISYKRNQNDSDDHQVTGFGVDKEKELLSVSFSGHLPLGEGHLKISYTGEVASNLKGFFRSQYKGSQGEDRFHYLTKFEPTFARCCFPCWDEPSIKATYNITLTVPRHLVAVSNMPVKEEFPHANLDKKIVKFERSVKMSTYVMAFAIGEFDFVERRTTDGVLCRVYTPVGKKERGNFALDVVTKSLEFYQNYFGIPYPLPKMDLLGVTEFGSGAMENWGLVIFREQYLLMDENLSSSITKQHVAIVVAHETAHMWFGNLVTMEWWSDLWLNEGFATWMEYHCVSALYPEFEIWNLFMLDYMEALRLDASLNSHPIQATVEDPAQIGAIFDSISYKKGASVIRMIQNFMGNAKFKEGITHYLSQHLFGSAQTLDLWTTLTEKSEQEIDVIMPTFTEQMGYPLIAVKNITQDNGTKRLTLSYQKFWADPCSPDEKTYKWIIPITVRKQSDPVGVAVKCLLNKDPGDDFDLTIDAKPEEWVKLNADHVGYYRCTYPCHILSGFLPAIKSNEMQPLDRLGILDDLFANMKAGYSKSDEILKFLLAYKEEKEFPVWLGILNIITTMNGLLSDTSLSENFKSYGQSLISPTAKRLGWELREDEKSQDSLLRAAVLSRLVDLNADDVLAEARSRFGLHVSGAKAISPDLRTAVYKAVALEGESGFDALLKLYRNTDLLEEKVRILTAFGAINDKTVIQNVLEFGKSCEVNKQDIISILISLSAQGKQEISWNYFQANWEFFRDNFPTGHFLIRQVVQSVTSGFKTDEKAAEVEAFFQTHQFKGVERTLSQSLEDIRINKAWLERDRCSLQDFLNLNSSY